MNEPQGESHHDTVERYVTSIDGTRIGYLERDHGPGLVLVQGAMATAHTYDELSRALSATFTVYSAERRGRGISPRPYDPDHTIARDVEDVDAILEATGASRMFGLSSGAVITLAATRALPRIERAAVYEPPFYRRGISHAGVARLHDEVEREDWPAALVSSLRTAQTAPAPVRALPRALAKVLARMVLRIDDDTNGLNARLRDLLPGVLYDFNAVAGMDGQVNSLNTIVQPVLLISGTKSPAFLHEAIHDLHDVIPGASHIELDGLDHAGSWNRDRGGQPDVVAEALRDFFTPRTD